MHSFVVGSHLIENSESGDIERITVRSAGSVVKQLVTTLAALVFWLGALLIVYTHVGYPVVLAALVWMRGRVLDGEAGKLDAVPDAELPTVSLLIPAYDDREGVTAEFNKNLLVRINRELDGDFDLDGFAHRAIWNADQSRVEMHLVCRRTQHVTVRAAGFDFTMAEGESIWTESSYKYRPDDARAMLVRSGFEVVDQWIDGGFALTLASRSA